MTLYFDKDDSYNLHWIGGTRSVSKLHLKLDLNVILRDSFFWNDERIYLILDNWTREYNAFHWFKGLTLIVMEYICLKYDN